VKQRDKGKAVSPDSSLKIIPNLIFSTP